MATRIRRPQASTAAATRERSREIGPGLATAIFLGLAFVYFFPAFLPGRHIFGTDYLAGGYFFYDFVSERFGAGDLPKWVPYIFGGLPLFANPGSAYQPIHLLSSVLLPTSRILPAVLVIHFALAGIGMYGLARELGARGWVAVIAGICFQFTGLISSWVYAGHDGRIIVATLAPMFFFLLRRGIRTASLGSFAGAAATLGLALLSFQIQNSYYLLVAAALWSMYSIAHLGLFREPSRLARVVALGFGAVAFGFLMATVNFLPFFDYIGQSPRGQEGGRGYEYATSFSMPEDELLSMAVPEAHGVSVVDPSTGEPLFPDYTGENGFKLHTEYVGALALLLLALGFYYSRRSRDWLFFLGLAVFMLTIALGGNTPLYRLYYALLPGTQQFRAPSLSFFVVALALASMAAITLEQLARLRERPEGAAEPAEPAPSALGRLPWIAGAVVLVALLGAVVADRSATGWGRFLLFTGASAAALWLWSRRSLSTLVLAGFLALVTLADLWVIGKRFFHTVDPPSVAFAADDVISFLQSRPQPSRVWTFPLVQQYRGGGAYGSDFPMLYDLQQVGGEHPNPLQSWVEYIGAGTETYIDWHNLIREAGLVITAEGQAVGFNDVPGFLDAANVRYIVSMAPLSSPGLEEVHRGSALIYENTRALPRAYLVPRARAVPAGRALLAMTDTTWDPRELAFVTDGAGIEISSSELQGEADVVEYAPDRVVVRATTDQPALLVLADNFYEGWRATVNGEEAPVLRTNHTFRGVAVQAGTSQVVFEFVPVDLYVGFALYLGSLVLLASYGLWTLLVHQRRQPLESA